MHTNYKRLAGQNIYALPTKKKKKVKIKAKKRRNPAHKKHIPMENTYAFIVSSEFLKTKKWRELRYRALLEYGKRCHCCGASPKEGAALNVDHIKPRAKHPELALRLDNLQILCHDCNHGKGNWDSTDHRD